MVLLPFQLDPGFIPNVKKGDLVQVGDILAERKNTDNKAIPLASIFGVKTHAAGKFLKVNPGDSVSVGDILAIRKGVFKEDKVFSEVSGTVMAYDRSSGELILHPSSTSGKKYEEIRCPIDGIVTVCNNDQIVIETEKDVVVGEKGSGTQAEGILLQPDKVNGSNTIYTLDTQIEGKILALQSSDRDILLKAIGMDVGGILAGEISESDLSYLSKRNIPTPVIQLSETEWKKMVKWVGKKVYVDAAGKTVLLLHV